MGIKVTAYRSILGPEQLQFHPGHPGRRINSAADYLGWHTRLVTSRGGDPWDSPRKTVARVNHGRWIADCVWCNTGMQTRPDWGVAFCAECGARYFQKKIKFPKKLKAIEAPLLVRVRRDQQNWDDRQTPEDLEAENLTHEVLTIGDIDFEDEEEHE